jgi:hypothetical protein
LPGWLEGLKLGLCGLPALVLESARKTSKGRVVPKKATKVPAKKKPLPAKTATAAKVAAPAAKVAAPPAKVAAPAEKVAAQATAPKPKAPVAVPKPVPAHQQFLSKGGIKPQAMMKARIIRHQGR